MSQADAQMVKRHLLDALASRPTYALVASLDGIAEYLDEAGATHLVHSFTQALLGEHDTNLDDEIADLIYRSLPQMQADVERCVVTLLTDEKQQSKDDGSVYSLKKVRRALGELEIEPERRVDDLEDLPF